MNFLKSSFGCLRIYFLFCLIIFTCFEKVFSNWNLEWLKSQLSLKSNISSNNGIEKFNIPDLSGRIMSFVDYNDDKFTDIVLYSQNEGRIMILLWNNTSNEFYDGPYFQLENEVVSLLTADWNGDGYIDILVTYYLQREDKNKNKYGIILLAQNPINKNLIKIWNSDRESFTTVEPLVIDINGDGMLDLLSESQGKRFVWVNTKEEIVKNMQDGNSVNLINFKKYEWGDELSQWIHFDSSKSNYGRLVENHFSAFIDMDGDCRSDLVLEVYYEDGEYITGLGGPKIRKGLEIWTNKLINGVMKFTRYIPKNQEFSNDIKPIMLPMGSGSILFSDFNRDGTIDLIVPICIMRENGCESKSRLVFIPNIHEHKNCVETKQFGFSKHFGIKGSLTNSDINCKSSKLLCKPSLFEIHSFTDEDNKIIFEDMEVTPTEKNNPSFFSSLFGPKPNEPNKTTGTLYQGFTVSALGDDDFLDGESESNINRKESETIYSNSMSNQMASLFSFFPVKKNKDTKLQWACNERNSILMSIGDYNLDGYPDILAVVEFPNNTRQSRLMENLPIFNEKELNKSVTVSMNKVSEVDSINHSKKWQANILKLLKSTFFWLSGSFLNSDTYLYTDSVYRRFEISRGVDTHTVFSVDYAAFFDIFDDNSLDIISVSFPNNNGKCEIETRFSPNDNPSLFIKVTVLSYFSNFRNSDYKKIGTTSFGITVKIRMTGLVGNDIFMTATQLSQSTNRILQTPFVLFGLGKTNNYIEELYVGTNYIDENKIFNENYSKLEYGNLLNEGNNLWQSSRDQFTNSNTWTGLIPNTQVIAQLIPLSNPSAWTLVLSVSPKKTIKGILVVSILALVIIGIIVLILDQKEKAEDLKEHQGFKNNFISA